MGLTGEKMSSETFTGKAWISIEREYSIVMHVIVFTATFIIIIVSNFISKIFFF